MEHAERTRIAVETLYKEFQRAQAKSAAADDWFFRFLSIAVIPFIGFLGFCAANPGYRIFVATLPILSVIGILVVAVLSSHYLYAGMYSTYLQSKINQLLEVDALPAISFDAAAYRRFTPVTVSYVIGLALLTLINILAAPFITREIVRFRATHPHVAGVAAQVLNHYWLLMGALILIVSAAAAWSFVATSTRLHLLLTTYSAKRLGLIEAPATNTAADASPIEVANFDECR
jgi:hypothetical protein